MGPIHYSLGFEALCTNNGLSLTQTNYAKEYLRKTNMDGANPSPTPMCLGKKLYLGDSKLFYHPIVYRSTIGALQYLTMTRSYLAFAVNKLSQFLQAPIVNHWAACKRLLHCVR